MALVSQLLTMQQAGTRQLAQIAVMKKSFDMEKAVANLLDPAQNAGPPPSPGTGHLVDRRA